MQISVSSTLTLFHDGQFWVGVIERREDGKLSVARIVFGAEPSNEEILHLVADKWHTLRFVGSIAAETPALSRNPKRRQREAAKELLKRGASTKSQIALSDAREVQKVDAKASSARAKHQEELDRYEQKRAKRKQKRRGH